jgi:CRISPR-associated protein Cas1
MHIVLNTFGASLQKENGLFVVSHTDGRQTLDPSKVKTISISKGARISSDAALLAIDNNVEVLFVDGIGMPQGRLWSVKYGSISEIRRRQLEFIYSPKAVEWIKGIVLKKMDNQIAFILSLDSDELENSRKGAINKITGYKVKVQEAEADFISEIASTLRGWEGAASKVYFSVIALHLPESVRPQGRSQHPAKDGFNAILNYGYGMLYGKVEGALIKAGIDPYAGIFHRDEYNRPALAFDVVEIYRVWIDYVVFALAAQEVFSHDCFSEKDDGVWLETLGKRILIQAVNDYFEEVITLDALERSRNMQIELYAHKLAKMFLNS